MSGTKTLKVYCSGWTNIPVKLNPSHESLSQPVNAKACMAASSHVHTPSYIWSKSASVGVFVLCQKVELSVQSE